jgi:hypothetical protein
MTDIQNILDERKKTHGSFEVSSYTSQVLKDNMRDSPNWVELDMDQKECLDMVAHKMARILCGNPNELDHYVDIIGYCTLVLNRLKVDQV